MNEKANSLKINLSKVKKVRIKKPSIGIPRSKNNSSSPYNINFAKKRPKSAQSNAVRKRLPPKSRQKSPLLAASSGLNGLSNERAVVASNAEPNSNQVPRLPMVPPAFSWANSTTKSAGNVSDDGDANVGEYAQYLELKPSVKFKCYRCGTNDFGTMASLQSHIATCSGPSCTDAVNHSSPVRTMKPATGPPTTSPNLRITRQVYLCSSCGTYFQNYNLYIHMRDKHNKQICLYCRSIFARSEQLWDHLVSAHKLTSTAYSSVSQIRDAFKNSFYITCCSCNTIFSENEPFNEHSCEVGSSLAAVDTSLCTNCKPVTSASVESTAIRPAIDKHESPRRESVSSREDDDESKAEFQDEFRSRNSTLDFIGVPEEHTVTSQPDEDKPNDVEEPKTLPEKVIDPEPEKMDDLSPVEVDDPVPVTPPPKCYPTETTVESENEENQKSMPIDASEHLSPPHSDGNESFHEPESAVSDAMESESAAPHVTDFESAAPDATEVLNSIAEPPVDENHGHYSTSATNIVPCEERTPTSGDDNNGDVTPTEPPETDVAVAELNETAPDHLDTSCAENKDLKPLIETPPPEPIDATPAPLPMALMLDETVDSLSVLTLIKECVRTSCLSCLYCNNATLIAVNGANLVTHLLAEHRFMPTKHEDDSQMVIQKLESGIQDLSSIHMNASHSTHREIFFDGTFACLQCSFTTSLFKDLCNHKRRTHHKIIFLCIMCKCNFQFYSQLLCHLCPGSYLSESLHTLQYHCCFCDVDVIPSAFRLMVHLRKVHQACDICLSQHADQSELYTHMIKQHKISHLCYKCNLAWRNRDDINKHLFWKHGTESVLCKRCLQKKWPHAYHFCIPASTYTCDECSRIFSKAVALTVHRRVHNGEFPFACDLCEQRCISKKLLAAHKETVHQIMREPKPDAPKEEEPAEESAQNEAEQQPSNEVQSVDDESKEHRTSKKKRRKMKNGNEKPLLDELPPLNLSSESEDESADEEQSAVKREAPPVTAEPADEASAPSPLMGDEQPEQSAAPVDAPDNAASEDERQEVCAILNELAVAAVAAAQPPTRMVTPTEESAAKAVEPPAPENTSATNADVIEKMLNCLIVEHSYCIPDCLFRSSDAANQSAMSEGSDNATSGKQHSKRDKSCSKSITPRKHKHLPKKESSSSESSSDSDSSSSSCGSNCSCNSSSSSSESTTPEKRTTSKKSPRSSSKEKSSANTTADGGATGEYSLLSVPESDLDTEITVSDEDFYEEHPFYVPPPPPVEPEPTVTQTAPLPYENRLTISREPTSRTDCRSKKRRKKPKITINLGGLQRSYKAPKASQNASANSSASSHDHQISSSGSYSSTPTTSGAFYRASPATAYSNCVSSTTGTATPPALLSGRGNGDSAGRLSKRKRVKNRFYGYSSSDESGGGCYDGHEAMSTSLKTTIQLKKRPPSKKPKSRQPFVGIRAKRPPGLLIRPPTQSQQRSPSISSTTGGYASASSNMYRVAPPINNVNHQQQPPQQQRTFLKPIVPSSSDDSDSDEKRHKLVINLPVTKEKQQQPNSRLSYGFANAGSLLASGGGGNAGHREPYAGSSWFGQRTSSQPQQLQLPNAQSTPTKKEIYCFCRCPYDEVSEMIACDAPNCPIEWFHFECVGIMAAPQGQWFCPNCRKNPENISRSF